MALTSPNNSLPTDQATATPDTPEQGRIRTWLTAQHWVSRQQILLTFGLYVAIAVAAVFAIVAQGQLR